MATNDTVMMLSPSAYFTDPPFVIKGESGYLCSQVSYCMVNYASQYYSDNLFATIRQKIPEKVLTAVSKRRSEHFAGRYCCSVLLKQYSDYSNTVGSHNGIPVWPEGWTGSISHTDKYAIAVASKENADLCLGIDIEQHIPELLLQTADLFTTTNEQKYLMSLSIPYSLALLIVFSAKESLFKALYPELNGFIDFDMSYISNINSVCKTFTMTLSHHISERLFVGRVFHGQYDYIADHVITFFMVKI